jgi:hypothetical protein
LHQLEVPNRLAKLFAFARVRQGQIQRRLHDAERPGRRHNAFIVQARHQDLNAPVQLTQQVLGRHFAVIEDQLTGTRPAHAKFVQWLRSGKSLKATLNNKSTDAGFARIGRCLGVDHIAVGIGTVGRPHLVAIQDEAIPLAVGAQLHADHVRARACLAHGQRAHVLAADQLGQIARLLFGIAVEPQLVHMQIGMRDVRDAHRPRRAADLLRRNHVSQIAQANAAVFGFCRDAQNPQFA